MHQGCSIDFDRKKERAVFLYMGVLCFELDELTA